MGNIYTKDYLKDSKLGVHFLNLKNKTQALMKKNKSLIKDKTENLIDKEIMIDLNELISSKAYCLFYRKRMFQTVGESNN